jgi:hypothetical protein
LPVYNSKQYYSYVSLFAVIHAFMCDDKREHQV